MNSSFHRLKSLETIDHASMHPEENGAVAKCFDHSMVAKPLSLAKVMTKAILLDGN